MTITVRKALRARRTSARHRTVRQLDPLVDDLASQEPTPELAASVANEFRRLLRQLDDERLRAVALAKLEGYTNKEIAQRQGKSISYVERKLRVIRGIWADESPYAC